jgi:integrase
VAAQTKRLSARFVDSVTEPGLHADGDGLYLNVSPKGAKRWVFIFQLKASGRSQSRAELSLGGLSVLSLAEAREAAVDARKLVARGIDPIEARKKAKQSNAAAVVTFGTFAADLIDSLEPGFRNAKHVEQWRMTLSVERDKEGNWVDSGYCLALRPKAPNQIDTADILGVLTPIWQTKAETASRVRGRIERVLDAAKAKGLRSGENPARWRGHLDTLLPKRQKLTRGHHAAMPYTAVPSFIAKLRAAGGVGARALEFLILNTSRTGEVIGARWPEVDFAAKVWTVPPERMKSGVEHRKPLSDRAIEILNAFYETRLSDYVFPGVGRGTHISNLTMNKALTTAGGKDFTVHGFRSSFRDWAGEETTFPEAIAEQALAHIIGDETVRAYRRGDALAKRRKLMEAWAKYCHPPIRSNVVQLAGNRTPAA